MFSTALVLSVAAAASTTQEIACPAELPASAIAVTHAPEGWAGFVPTRLLLHDVGLGTGPLEDRATLVGEHRKLGRGAFTVTYGALRGWDKRDRWLMCRYGEGNDIVVAKRLPGGVDQCSVAYTPDQWGGNNIKIACR